MAASMKDQSAASSGAAGNMDEYHHNTLRSGAIQPTQIAAASGSSDHNSYNGSSEELARSIAKRNVGDPNAAKRASQVAHDDDADADALPDNDPVNASSDKEMAAKALRDQRKDTTKSGKIHGLSKLKLPIFVSGAILAVIGAAFAITKHSPRKHAEHDM